MFLHLVDSIFKCNSSLYIQHIIKLSDSERKHKCSVHSKATAGLRLVLVVVLVNSEELNWKIHKSVERIVSPLIKCFFPYEFCSASASSVSDILHYRHVTNLRISRRLYKE